MHVKILGPHIQARHNHAAKNEVKAPDPIYEFQLPRLKSKFKQPYSQRVQELLKEHDLENLSIEPPSFETVSNVTPPNIDLSLTKKINKLDDKQESRIKANLHIIRNYNSHNSIYTDGSKDPKKEISGYGIVIYDENGTCNVEKSFKVNAHASIYTCELAAILHALVIIHTHKHIYKEKKVALFTDSLSSLQSIQAGHSNNRPILLNNILKLITLLNNNNTEISLVWVPSHVGLDGNEKADQLAKEGSISGEHIHIKLSVKEGFSIIKEKNQSKISCTVE